VTVLLFASLALGVLAVGLSEAPAGVGYWLLAGILASGVMATIVLTTKTARVTNESDVERTSTAAAEAGNVTPLRRDVG
jgi:hypothetical protein